MRNDEMGFRYAAESSKNLGPVAGSNFITASEAAFIFPMTAKQLRGCFAAQIAVEISNIGQAKGREKPKGQLPVNLVWFWVDGSL